ncbi:MAG TPA: ABC transporter transmembrane domain-containing protein [Stellaceae bacterium]|nr:ABC transporter transmembrane domain-containing protein [Stellaceae bacterium]
MREFYDYVWRSSASQQIVLIILAIMAALLAMALLELQRHIVNILAGHEEAERLAWLCGAYSIAALGISGLKCTVNIKSAGLGEAMIRSLREVIFRNGPPLSPDETPGETAKDQSGTFVTMTATEAEAVWKFVGDCISTPIVQAGTLLSVLGYMLYTEPRLGLVVLLIAVPQIFLVPVIQRRINVQVRERVRTLRHAGDLIVGDMQTVRGSANSLKSEVGRAFETIYGVRLRVFQLKFGLKFLVGGLQSVGVFAPLFVGGIMVLNGKTEIGIVVAFISGLDRVLDPWRELIAFVRSTSAAKVQFDLIESTLGRKL